MVGILKIQINGFHVIQFQIVGHQKAVDQVKGVVLPVAGIGLIQRTAAGTRSIVDQINIMGQFVFGKNAGRPFALPAAADMGGFCERLIKIAASDDIVALAIFSLISSTSWRVWATLPSPSS